MSSRSAAVRGRLRALLTDRVRRFARLGAYLLFVVMLLATLAARAAWADLGRSSLALGRELAEFGNDDAGIHRVSLNGEKIMVSSSMLDEPYDKVLDAFEKRCRDSHSGLDDVPSFSEKANPPSRWRSLARAGVLRAQGDGEGSIMCFARDDHGLASFVAGVRAFTKSHDLNDVGRVRYTFVRRTPNDPNRTHAVVVWTDGHFDVGKVLGETNDDPTTDSPLVPRPTGATRLLDARLDNTRYGIKVFTTEATPDAVLAHYDAALPPLGWKVLPIDFSPTKGHAYMLPDADLLVSVSTDRQGRTVVSTTEYYAGVANKLRPQHAATGRSADAPPAASAP